MEVKSLGGGKNFARTIGYLGTTGDLTPAHKNLGILGYRKAKQSGNRKLMNYFSPYLRRDLMTFGNMPCGNKAQISHYERLVMSNNSRKVKSRQFILMPSDKDRINPNDPDSVLRFKKYITKWVDSSFNGQFKKAGKTKNENARYKFIKNNKQNFNWYAVIQPDSHDNSRVHAHIVVLNNNLMNGKAMGNNYYNIYHLRRAVNKVANDTGFSRATTKKSIHEPSRIEKWIIESARNIMNNPDITSRSKFIKALAKNGVTAHFRRNRKHPERSGWKFKVHNHSYIKASHISHAVGGSFLATDNIKKELSENRKLHAKQKRKIMAKQEAKFAKAQRIKEHRYMMNIEQNEMKKLERTMKRDKRKKRKKRAYLLKERPSGLAKVQRAIKKSRQVRHQHDQECQRYHKEAKEEARSGAFTKNYAKRPVSSFKDTISKRLGQIGKKIKGWLGSIFKHPQHPKYKAVKHAKTSWRDYERSSIKADKYVRNEAKEAIGKKPHKPTHQVQSSVATTPKSSTAKSESDSDSGSLDKQILKRAKQLRSERGKGEPPLP